MKKWRPSNPLPHIHDPKVIKRLVSKVKVDRETDCWLWTGHLHTRGYGQLWYDGMTRQSHRVSYAIFNGVIDTGLTIDHTCHNPACCNPAHLVTETLSENCTKNQHCDRYKQAQEGDEIPI